MKINEIKTILQENMQQSLTEHAKQEIVKYVDEHVLDALEEVANEYIATLQAHSKQELGWVKFRDMIFIPMVIKISLYLLKNSSKQILNK